MDLKLKVRKTIEKNELIEKDSRVLLALSGGPDSVCLLSILHDLQKPLDFKLYAFHVNHMIRGKDADDDEKYCYMLCEKLGIPFESIRIDVPTLAHKKNKTEEEMGRLVRYEQLKSFATSIDAKYIALAHNKNDQAETVLMRILRGSGVHGLCGMDYKREDGIIRPLLDCDRDEIEKYCDDKKLNPHVDKTNLETEYTRNKIRIALIPLLEENFNPSIVDALVRLSQSAKDDDSALNALAKNLSTNSVKELAAMDDALFSRVVVNLFKEKGLCEDISFVHINALRNAVLNNVGNKTIQFPQKYKAEIKRGKVIISHD